jgi:hypothetical protein
MPHSQGAVFYVESSGSPAVEMWQDTRPRLSREKRRVGQEYYKMDCHDIVMILDGTLSYIPPKCAKFFKINPCFSKKLEI